jgi:hypothetical protein
MTEKKVGVKTGIYRHYKGNLYHVVGEAIHSETGELLVVYRALYGEYKLWVRPKTMFFESVGVNGKAVPRFTLEVEVDN